MATTYKILGQVQPTLGTNTTLYTVPSATSTVISTLTICNAGLNAGTYNVAVRQAGASLTGAQYIAFSASLNPGDTSALTMGMTLAATDVVTVYSSNAGLSFNLFGSEIS